MSGRQTRQWCWAATRAGAGRRAAVVGQKEAWAGRKGRQIESGDQTGGWQPGPNQLSPQRLYRLMLMRHAFLGPAHSSKLIAPGA